MSSSRIFRFFRSRITRFGARNGTGACAPWKTALFLLLVIAVSLAFAWILWPFFSAVLWATVLAIVFAPLYRRILHSIGQHPNLAALTTLLIVVTLVILPFR